MPLLGQLVSSNFLKISPSAGFDYYRGIERLGETNCVPIDCKGFASSFAALTLNSCAIYLQRTFPRILNARYATTGAIVGFTMNDGASVMVDGVEGRAPAILLVKGTAVCEIVEPQANLIAVVNFDSIEDRGWPGAGDRAQFVMAEPTRFEALQAIIRDVLLRVSNEPDVFSQSGEREAVEESIVKAVDHAIHAAPLASKTNRSNLASYLSLVRKFDEFLAANAGQTLYSAEMAKQFGVPVRTLHNAVIAIRGMSIHRYTRLKRLWKVRQQLVQGSSTSVIKAIALANGFWNMGEFISLYRDLFREAPHQTLLRARPNQTGMR